MNLKILNYRISHIFHKEIISILVLISYVMPLLTSYFNFRGIYLKSIITILSLFLFFIYKENWKNRLSLESKFIILWLFWVIFSGYFLHNMSILNEFNRNIIICVIFFLIINNAKDNDIVHIVLSRIYIGSIIFILISFIAFDSSIFSIDMRFGDSLLNNSNEYAYTLLFGIFASVYMITASRIKINIIFHYIILICLTYLIIISGSRKVLFGEMIFISSYLIMYIYNSIRYNSLKTFLISLFLSFILFQTFNYTINNSFIGDRIINTFEDESQNLVFSERFSGRGQFYVIGWEIFNQNPISGIGLHNFREYYINNNPTHSDYLTALVETGIIGFILYYSIYLISLRKFFRIYNNKMSKEYIIIFLAVITILIVALGRSNHMNIPTFIFLALIGQMYKLKNN